MKKSASFLLVLVVLFFGSCSSSSDSPDSENPNPGENPDPTSIDKTANLKATGSSGNDILSNTNFDKLLIEIDYVQGFRPEESAITGFTNYFLKKHTFKEDIEVTYTELASPNEETLTLQEVADLEQEHRNSYNSGKTLAIYIYFADAPDDTDEPDNDIVTLGAVYRNTSMVIYQKTIDNLAQEGGLSSTVDIETATLNHEFGHLFGLVNLGTDMVNPHEDVVRDENGDPVLTDGEETPNNHCNADICLMRAELQFGQTNKSAKVNNNKVYSSCALNGNTLLSKMKSNAAKGLLVFPGLDSDCILDIQAIGGR